MLTAYGIPDRANAVRSFAAGGREDRRGSSQAEPDVVVKILSDDISHKSDVGGVRLGLRIAARSAQAAEGCSDRVAELRPEARHAGFHRAADDRAAERA